MSTALPPAAPDVVAAAVEGLTSRLRKKLDDAVAQYAAAPATAAADGSVTVVCGEDTAVTLTPGPSGVITAPEQAACTCLLAPRCLHRAAVLTACPLPDPDLAPAPPPDAPEPPAQTGADALDLLAQTGSDVPGHLAQAGADASERLSRTGSGAPETGRSGAADAGAAATGGRSGARTPAGAVAEAAGGAGPDEAKAAPKALTPAQRAAAEGLWTAAAAVLATGVPAAGAVPQAELLRAAHTGRLAGLYRAEAAALRVVRGLRAARARRDGHRLADLADALRELLLTTGLLRAGHCDPALLGAARRAYQPGSGLRVYGVCREPVISATGYGGVVTHLVTEDGRWFSVADVKPGGPARARGAANAPVALGGVALDHAGLSRGGLLVVGATVSPDGRLGSGKGVRATPIRGLSWPESPAVLFGRPLAESVAGRLTGDPGADPEQADVRARAPIGCDLVVVGPAGDHVLAREILPGESVPRGPLIRLTPASRHPDLAHLPNLRQLADRPGLHLRVVARVDPDRAATLVPLAVGPAPCGPTLALPAQWQGHADLGYDRLQGSHFPPAAELEPPLSAPPAPDPLATSPLWRVRRLVELAVAGGRRAVAESVRTPTATDAATLGRTGFPAAAALAVALTAEAGRRTRDVFGRLDDPDPHRFASSWLASAVHLTAAERALIQSTWQPEELAM